MAMAGEDAVAGVVLRLRGDIPSWLRSRGPRRLESGVVAPVVMDRAGFERCEGDDVVGAEKI